MELVYTSSSHAIAQHFSSPVLSDNIARNGRDSINETKYLCIFGGGENEYFPFLSFPFYSIRGFQVVDRTNFVSNFVLSIPFLSYRVLLVLLVYSYSSLHAFTFIITRRTAIFPYRRSPPQNFALSIGNKV